MTILRLEDIDAYREALELSNHIWTLVLSWDSFSKWTVGKQYVEAADSVPANLSEGWGRYYKKEKIQFYRYSYGSLEETKNWTRKAIQRKLLNEKEAALINEKLEKLPKLIHQLIQYTNTKLKY